ncbi:hypothetical protein DFH07DRAFT_776270 [Mycena maculata]|uniref:Uncharacterized protein n=1 Tax=Mycena maculata TaxID=230809 RepID=A0AAD7N4Y4_9AGAR|nr:hypothetical protein DFH07DRAFT_776270 [Mycena maculata]
MVTKVLEFAPLAELGDWINSLLVTGDPYLSGLRSNNAVIVILLGSALTTVSFLLFKRQRTIKPADNTPEKSPPRTLNVKQWFPQSFEYPDFEASPYALSDIKPPMYRPFRWGEYHVTMGIRNMQWGEWIELDDQFNAYYRIRKDRIERKGELVVKVLPPSVREHDGEDGNIRIRGGAAGAIELVHELAEYLSRRYPTTFQITRHASTMPDYPTGWGGTPPVKSVFIVPQQEQFELPLPLPLDFIPGDEKPDIEKQGAIAMRIAALLVQDDLAVMVEGSNGGYYFQAGGIVVPGFWRMEDKIGMRLDEIHLSGNVPQYQEKLHTSFERFFRRLPVDKPVARNNYFVQVSPPSSATPSVDPDELAWGETVLGPEDEYGGTKGSSGGDPPVLVVAPETLRLRTERQTLRRLPRSGAVVFTIRTYLVPVEELAQEPGVAARFASAVRSWPEEVREYKGERRYGDVLVRYLDEVASRDDAERVEAKPYPF